MSGLKEEVKEGEMDGRYQTELLGAQDPMSHSTVGFYS